MDSPQLLHDDVSTSYLPELFPLTHTRTLNLPHASAIINDLCLQSGYYDAKDSPNLTRLHLGQAVEHAIAEGYRRSHHDPSRFILGYELIRDGIVLTPDLPELPVSNEPDRIHEMKLTWMSSSHDILSTKFWRYWCQLRAYCHAMEIGCGVLHIVHVNGDYKDSGPIYRPWLWEFSQRSLIQNWSLLTTHRDRMIKEGRASWLLE